MNRIRTPKLGAGRSLLALVAMTMLPVAVPAQDLPPARELVDRYIEAIGGRDAVLAPTSTRSTGQFSMPTAGISGDMELLQAEPGLTRMRIEIPGFGEVLTGYDGEVAWQVDPMTGPRVMEGLEKAQVTDEAVPESSLRDPAYVESLETVERTTLNDVDCYKVKVVWKSGRESFDCYAVDSGLIVGMELKSTSPMGTMDVTVLVSDYKEFGGVLMPTRMTQLTMGQEQVFTISNVEFNGVDRAVFELPAEIKVLVNK